jgi:hypothetical protein
VIKQNQTLFPILALCILAGAIILTMALISPSGPLVALDACAGSHVSGCTVFTVSKGDQVFFGGNDDYINPDSYYWVDPGSAQDYGAIWIGTPDNVQQGINEKGLAYDANGLPRVDTNPHPERVPVTGGYGSYPIHILHQCATVEEVIGWVKAHQWHSYMHDQMQFADATGDAVIISAGKDGELAFTRKPRGDSFLVSTNFNVANPTNGYGYPCWRYDRATKQLSALVQQEGKLTAQDATGVLDAVHVEGGSSWTLESLVADLPNGIVYLYYFHQFDKPVVLNVAEEIANPRPPGPLSKLFPEEVRQEAALRYQHAGSRQGSCAWVGKAWLGLVLASLVVLVKNSRGDPWRLLFWLLVTLILGPLGLLIWWVSGHQQKASTWQVALVEAAGNITPVAVAYMVMLTVVILVPQAQFNVALQVFFVFILPLLFSLIFFQGPLLALTARRNYLYILRHRLPAVWVVCNLGMGGISPLAVRLVRWLANICSMMGFSVWTALSLWAAVVTGAFLGILLVMVYEGWAVRRGFHAWSALAYGDSEVTSPSWRKLWWWLVLSFAILVGGILID